MLLLRHLLDDAKEVQAVVRWPLDRPLVELTGDVAAVQRVQVVVQEL